MSWFTAGQLAATQAYNVVIDIRVPITSSSRIVSSSKGKQDSRARHIGSRYEKPIGRLRRPAVLETTVLATGQQDAKNKIVRVMARG